MAHLSFSTFQGIWFIHYFFNISFTFNNSCILKMETTLDADQKQQSAASDLGPQYLPILKSISVNAGHKCRETDTVGI